ncbi:MAG: substrate-binding domain-containing protein [Opitutae bacterium]|nr:substrate-binding domain-containing protein [Opitutae bacterium]
MLKPNLIVTFLAWLLFSAVGALSAERDPNMLHVLSSNASHPAISKLVPLFEQQFQAKVRVEYANNPILKQQIEAGAEFDVVIIEPKMLQELAQRGLVAENSIVPLAAIGMALVSKEGAPAVDIGSVESFKKVLLSAKSIAYTADGHSGAVFLSTLEKLGLTEQMKPKLVPVVGRLSTLAVAEGEAQYTAFPLAGSVPGGQMAGKFPDAVQTYIGISAAKSSRSLGPVLRDKFLKYLQSEPARTLFGSMGFSPAPSRQK